MHETARLTMFDRFNIQDRKGLEIVILSALLSFQDLNETYHTPKDGSNATSPVPVPAVSATSPSSPGPPAVPPRPEPRHGLERVSEMHTVRSAQGEGDANEVYVCEECDIEDYARYAEKLLNVSIHIPTVHCCWVLRSRAKKAGR